MCIPLLTNLWRKRYYYTHRIDKEIASELIKFSKDPHQETNFRTRACQHSAMLSHSMLSPADTEWHTGRNMVNCSVPNPGPNQIPGTFVTLLGSAPQTPSSWLATLHAEQILMNTLSEWPWVQSGLWCCPSRIQNKTTLDSEIKLYFCEITQNILVGWNENGFLRLFWLSLAHALLGARAHIHSSYRAIQPCP